DRARRTPPLFTGAPHGRILGPDSRGAEGSGVHPRTESQSEGTTMAADEGGASGKGWFSRTWRRLTTPSARWSVLSLVVIGFVVGAGAIIATKVMVDVTGTNEFCSNACHSMQWVAAEYRQSNHHLNRTGVQAGCHDCHIPHHYPELLWYKAKAGMKDVI